MLRALFAQKETCPACGHQFRFGLDTCPRCTHRLAVAPTYRAWGGLFLLAGNVLCAVMAFLFWSAARIMLHTGQPGATSSFSGTRGEAVLVLATLAAAVACGLLMVGGGAYAIVRGRVMLGAAGKARLLHFMLVADLVLCLVLLLFQIAELAGLLPE
ncbi:MAG: hypothetical protein J0L64_16855 [Acidobacteria bacterium]|nr:hypothetical protein [Acidobacteriota bacterium]